MICDNLENSDGVKTHFENEMEKIREIILTNRFKKDAPNFEIKDVVGCEHVHFTRQHKFEKHVGELHIFRALKNKIHYVYAIDKNFRLIFLRAFKNFKEYEKYLENGREIKIESERFK